MYEEGKIYQFYLYECKLILSSIGSKQIKFPFIRKTVYPGIFYAKLKRLNIVSFYPNIFVKIGLQLNSLATIFQDENEDRTASHLFGLDRPAGNFLS